jgi:hypothetical protein
MSWRANRESGHLCGAKGFLEQGSRTYRVLNNLLEQSTALLIDDGGIHFWRTEEKSMMKERERSAVIHSSRTLFGVDRGGRHMLG